MLAESQWPVRSTWRRTERGHRDEEERHDSAAHDGPTEHRSGRHPPSPTALSPLLRYLAPSPSVHPASTSDSCVPLPGFTRSISCSSPIFVQNGARLATAECCRLCHVLLLTFSSLFFLVLQRLFKALFCCRFLESRGVQSGPPLAADVVDSAASIRPSIRAQQLSCPSARSARDFEPPQRSAVASPLPRHLRCSFFARIAAKFSLHGIRTQWSDDVAQRTPQLLTIVWRSKDARILKIRNRTWLH